MKLFCMRVGFSESAFSIEIDSNATVDDLKKVIYREIQSTVLPHQIKLFLAKRGDQWLSDDSDEVNTLEQGDVSKVQDLLDTRPLKPTIGVDELFLNLPRRAIHVLVQLPQDKDTRTIDNVAPPPPSPENIQKAHELTDHSEMIKYTYWGNHDAKTISPVVVQNRNRFVAVYAIKSVERNQTVTRYVSYGLNGRFRKLFDHYEQFRTANGKFVLVVSPYNHLASHSDWFTATCGFTEIAPIYMENALTFVKVGTEDEFADFSMLQN